MSRPLYFNTRAVIRNAIVPIFAGLLFMSCDASRDAIGPPPAPPPITPAPVTGVVTGTVTNTVNGRPIAGATVHIRTATVRTGPDGRFEFTAETVPWATYAGDRVRASWFPSEATAREWANFVASRAAAITASGQRSPKR